MQQHNRDTQKNEMVMITGATGGLGKAFAVECAGRGWDLFLTDFSDEGLEILASGLRNGYGIKVITLACDLTDPVMRDSLLNYIHKECLHFSMLINVAGVDYEGLFLERTSLQIQTILRLNIEGTLETIHTILPSRDPSSPFHIINVSSLAAFYPMPVKATYAASKRFLLDFSLALREEIRSLGATVTVLCPAGMPTNPETIRAIEAQGWAGQITTMDVGRVARQTLDAALAGKTIVIPGLANRILQGLGSLVPSSLVTWLIGKRWMSVQDRRKPGFQPLQPESGSGRQLLFRF